MSETSTASHALPHGHPDPAPVSRIQVSESSTGSGSVFQYESPSKRSMVSLRSTDADESRSTLLSERNAILRDVKTRMGGLLTSEFFQSMLKSANLDLEAHRLEICMALDDYINAGGNPDHWETTDKHISLRVRERALQAIADKWDAQQRRYSATQAANKDIVAVFQNFITARIGWNIDTNMGHRDDSAQSRLRQQFKEFSAYGPNDDRFHCPVKGGPVIADDITLAHIFPCKHGERTMKYIFGNQAELMSPRNVMLMDRHLEERFDQGYFAIVPDIHDLNDAKQVNTWRTSRVKPYKTMVLFPDEPKMKMTMFSDRHEPYTQFLQDRRLTFLTDMRPRARYFAFHYLYAYTKFFYTKVAKGPKKTDRRPQELEKTLGRPIWMTPGKYVGVGVARQFLQLAGYADDPELYTRSTVYENDDSDIEDDIDDHDEDGDLGIQVMETDVAHGTRAVQEVDEEE